MAGLLSGARRRPEPWRVPMLAKSRSMVSTVHHKHLPVWRALLAARFVALARRSLRRSQSLELRADRLKIATPKGLGPNGHEHTSPSSPRRLRPAMPGTY